VSDYNNFWQCSVISQGKVVARGRWGGKWSHLSMTHRLTTNYAKNYCNRTLIAKVIVEYVVTCFFGTQCSENNLKIILIASAYRLQLKSYISRNTSCICGRAIRLR